MGEVAVVFKVYPEDMSQFERIKSDISTKIKPRMMSERPIAFGLVAIIVTVVVPDGSGGSEKIEEELNKIPGISNVEVDSMDRL
jgi:elongation factor 1-beta